MGADQRGDPPRGDRIDYRQVSFVAAAAVAIVLAAFLLPGVVVDGPSSDAEFDSDGGTDGDGDGDTPPLEFDWLDWLDWFDWAENGGDGQAEPGPDDHSCTIVLDRDPVPGAVVTATVVVDGQPLTDAPVRFNDRPVGETDERGQVAGEVPYAEQLVITVDGDHDCVAEESVTGSTVSIGADTETPSVDTDVSSALSAHRAIAPKTETAIASAATTATESRESNSSVEYDVDGEIDITVAGTPDPGEQVEIQATIEGIPVREATVAVDGESVTETDSEGRAEITLPDDGSEQITVHVERGAFAESATIDIRLLEATMAPDGLTPVPGSDGSAVAEIGGEPAADATVTIDGEYQGQTDAMGELAIDLPRDPTTPVTVATDDQTATVTLAGQYAGSVAVFSVFLAGIGAVAYRVYGVRGPIGVGVFTAWAGVVLVVEAFYGSLASGGVLAASGAIAASILLGRSDSTAPLPAVVETVRGVGAWLVGRILAVVSALERLVDWAKRYASGISRRLTSLPRSVTALAVFVADWVRSLPGRVAAAIVHASTRVRPTTIAIATGAAVVLASGYVVGGWLGLLVAATLLAVGVVLYWVRSTADSDTSATEETPADRVSYPPPNAGESQSAFSIRELWRSVARRVDPGRWRTRTPGEIERTATRQGYPRDPLQELTGLFREVEYGDRAESRPVRERANAAFTALESSGASDESTDTNGTGPETDTPAPVRSAASPDGDRSAADTDEKQTDSTDGEPR